MYYGIVSVAVIMFSLQFYLNQQYEKENGSGFGASMVFCCLSNLAGLVVLLAVDGFRLEFSWFALFIAVLMMLNSLLYTICSMKAFDKINLSLYSVFSMLGGMSLPFAVGIVFYGEPITAGKAVCFILITISLSFTVRPNTKVSGWLYYAGIFLLNGLSGVLPKIYTESSFEKISAAGLSALAAFITALSSVVILISLKNKPKKISFKSAGATIAFGSLNCFANWLLMIALVHLPASAQYPLVTGGVMVISTILCLFTPDRPKKADWAAVAFSFLGIMALVVIP